MSEQSTAPSLLVTAWDSSRSSRFLIHSEVGTPDGSLKLDSLEAFDKACSLQKAAMPEETDEAYQTLALFNSEHIPSPLTETAMRRLMQEGFRLRPNVNLGDTTVSVVVHNGAAGLSGLAARTLGSAASTFGLAPPCPRKTDISVDEAIAFAAETVTKANSSVFSAADLWVWVTFKMQQGKNGRTVNFYSRRTESSQLEALRTAFHKERAPWTVEEALTGLRWIPDEEATELATIVRTHGHEI